MKDQDQFNIEKPDALDAEEIRRRYLTFWTDRQLFGVPITEVVQIVGMQEITELPEQPDYAKGVINLRGQIIPVMDVRLRFGKPEAEYGDRTCIIITHMQDSDFGLIVDEVDEVADIMPDRVSKPPRRNTDQINPYLTGIARLENTDTQKDKVVLLIHPGKILGTEESEAFVKAVGE